MQIPDSNSSFCLVDSQMNGMRLRIRTKMTCTSFDMNLRCLLEPTGPDEEMTPTKFSGTNVDLVAWLIFYSTMTLLRESCLILSRGGVGEHSKDMQTETHSLVFR